MPMSVKKTRAYIISQGKEYWGQQSSLIETLPIPQKSIAEYRFKDVCLPAWAKGLGIGDQNIIPVDTGYIVQDLEKDEWQCVDWFSYAFHLLNGLYERQIEDENGPIHSYSMHIKDYPVALWEYAWVNRIFMFLRKWAAQEAAAEETTLFGPLPRGKIVLTHDVDALRKTLAIRLKQTAFHLFNALRALARGKFQKFGDKVLEAIRFFFTTPSYLEAFNWMLDQEENAGKRSVFLFYGGQNNRFKTWLFDPNYTLKAEKYRLLRERIKNNGWVCGLHQSFEAWQDTGIMQNQKQRVESAMEQPITHCRQHWLKFSWKDTWRAQESAGFEVDYTLGFNDRFGFRNSSALAFQPWDTVENKPINLQAIPMILMDSHLYDYADLTDKERHDTMERLLNEVLFVGGTASIIWHPHSCARDYNMGDGYTTLLNLLSITSDQG